MSGQVLRGGALTYLAEAVRPWRPDPVWLLAGWDIAAVLLTGLACRRLNPAAHAGHTARELLVIAATALLAAGLLHRRGFYGHRAPRPRLSLAIPILHAFALMLLALLLWEGSTGLWQEPVAGAAAPDAILANRNWLFAWALAAPVVLLLTRHAAEATLVRAAPLQAGRRAILFGNGESAARLAIYLADNEALRIVGFVGVGIGAGGGMAPGMAPGVARWPVLGGLRAARDLIQAGEADLVIIALPEAASRRIGGILRRMSGMAVDIRLAPDTARFYRPDARVSAIGGLPFLHLSDKPISGFAAAAKRAEDLALGVPLLCLAAPVMLLVALAIRCDSPGPVLFVQPRLGFNNRVIRVRKFRTMRQCQGDAQGRLQAVRGDPRLTRLGGWLRRTSLDELPQLIDVVAGRMSLVGPRPHALGTEAAGLPFETAAAHYEARHRVKPGMTGWAQVNGWRGETDTVEKLRRRVEHDLHYIAHWSLWFDLRVLAMTATALVRGEAY
ncbi:MAG: exopolysaccharide biosynthesis polyprenyl glycosylphosphotransferase [Proteobacteria bacterium]|nr:exopolysaccharide biosynthesis polyprenyl glycosylphosphotransferase [Pseudomonadota bacterium]